MKTTDLLLLAGGAAAIYYFGSRVNTLSGLNFVPRGLSFVGGAARIVVGVQNPSSYPLTLRSVAANLIVNGNTFGNVSGFIPVVIAPNSETPVPLLFTPSIFGIAADILDAVNRDSLAVTAALQGSANVDNNSLPLNLQF